MNGTILQCLELFQCVHKPRRLGVRRLRDHILPCIHNPAYIGYHVLIQIHHFAIILFILASTTMIHISKSVEIITSLNPT